MRVIINADDCGRSAIDNQLIGSFMEKGLITSTTVMATGADLDGVKALYDTYKEIISFGVHLNITSGKPQAYSQLLHDNGFYIEKEDGCYWGAVKYRDLRSRWLSKPIRDALKKELLTQIEKVRDYGINVSHLDSHQHVHVTMGLINVMPDVISKSGVYKIRRMFNYIPNGLNKFTRQLWGGVFIA